jgi:hypothetical protein
MGLQILEQTGRLLDRLMSLDLCYKFGEKDNLKNLYEATQKAIGLSPADSVIYFTAQKLSSLLKPSDNVIITTGFRMPPQALGGETDGPVGAASLGRALYLGYKTSNFFLLEEELLKMMNEVARVAGLPISPDFLIPFPKTRDLAQKEAKRILKEIRPICIISIERPGANSEGEYNTSRGINISEHIAKVDILFEEAKQEGILTIGIGDVGNELGMGKIKEAVVQNVKTGSKVVPSVEVDIAIMAGVSNWGAHALAAMFAAIKGDLEVFHNGGIERTMITECIRQKAVDGSTRKPTITVDALPAEIHSSLVEMMKTIAHGALQISSGSLTGR